MTIKIMTLDIKPLFILSTTTVRIVTLSKLASAKLFFFFMLFFLLGNSGNLLSHSDHTLRKMCKITNGF